MHLSAGVAMGSSVVRPSTLLRGAALVATGAWLLLLGWLAATALFPGLRDSAPRFLAWLATPGSATAMTVALALAAASLGLLLASRPYDGVRVPFVLSAACAIAAGVLGLASYLPCAGSRPALWDAVADTLGLFLGGFEFPFGPGEACVHPAPLALHLARLLAIVATLSGAVSLLLTVSRAQLDRLGLLRARTVTLVVGLDDTSWPVVAGLAADRRGGRRCVLLVEDADPPLETRARAAGLLVLRTPAGDPLDLGSASLWRRVRRVHLLSGDSALNRARAAQLKDALADGSTVSGGATTLTLVARIDDPWHADDWTTSQIGDPHLVVDAIGTYEATASDLVERLRDLPPARVLLVGDTTLALAVCAELSQRGREDQFCDEDATPPVVTVVGPAANEVVADHRLRQHRFALDPLEVGAVDAEPDLATVVGLVRAAGPGTAVVITVAGTRLGGRLGVRFPDLPVFELSARDDVPPGAQPVVGQVVPFSLALTGADGRRGDAWERAARAVHDRYRRRFPGSPLAVAWEDLPREFYRESNRRQLHSVLDAMAALGRSWRPTSPEDVRFDPAQLACDEAGARIAEGSRLFDLSGPELERLAVAEHASWLAHYRADGWEYGATRDDPARRHPLLRPWADLPPEARERTRVGVIDTLVQLRALGYRPVRTGAEAWARFERLGGVEAEPLTAPLAWTAPTGERLTAPAGSWLVTDATGGRRTVTDESFRATHEQLADGTWRRAGTVRARLARDAEEVATQEGTTIAVPGSWLVEDADGHRWLVPPDHFTATYRRVG
ncbi:MAG: RyR domain-containing protein [Propionicimonas sp.]|uniref:RyR domain-containing protein n=1 Tax=Propionicimonas sp. TaxID=1955623 RepID=UPI003D0A7CFD